MGSIAFFTTQLEGITSPCSLLIGQYPHHMTLLPSSFYGERCYGTRLYCEGLVPVSLVVLYLWRLEPGAARFELCRWWACSVSFTLHSWLRDVWLLSGALSTNCPRKFTFKLWWPSCHTPPHSKRRNKGKCHYPSIHVKVYLHILRLWPVRLTHAWWLSCRRESRART